MKKLLVLLAVVLASVFGLIFLDSIAENTLLLWYRSTGSWETRPVVAIETTDTYAVSPVLNEHFDEAHPRGSYSAGKGGDTLAISYSSFYDYEWGVYRYRFINMGTRNACISSRQFPEFFSVRAIEIPPEKTVLVGITFKHAHPAIERGVLVRIKESCSTFPHGGKTSIDLVAPE
ncbi:MAG: hypothetical protein Q7S52_01470 [bacterium]|nr:hypothetical protein [bacterium]